MTHDDEGRMLKVWYSFLIKSETHAPLTQIKTGDTLKKGPKPLSTVGFCTLLPWTGACWHCNNQQKCRWLSTACSLQRIKPETRNHQPNKPNSSDIWGESPSPEASPEINYSSKGIDSREWAASSMQRLQHPAKSCNAVPRNAHVALKCLKCEKAAHRVTHGLDQGLQLLYHS